MNLEESCLGNIYIQLKLKYRLSLERRLRPFRTHCRRRPRAGRTLPCTSEIERERERDNEYLYLVLLKQDNYECDQLSYLEKNHDLACKEIWRFKH
jgi:hypothetical protein